MPASDGSISIGLAPDHQIERLVAKPGGRPTWLATGNDPSFRCTVDAADIAGGWYVVDGHAWVHRGRLYGPCFYPDYGGGLVEKNALPLRLSDTVEGEVSFDGSLVRFSSRPVTLRFDPSVVACEFEIERLTLRQIGKWQAAMMMLRSGLAPERGRRKRVGLLARLARRLLSGGPRALGDCLYEEYRERESGTADADYHGWLKFYDVVDEFQVERAAAEYAAMSAHPRVSVLVPVFDTPEPWLRKCIDSVLAQTYPHWELCIANDASTQPHVGSILDDYARRDVRIRVVHREANGHISEASNSALALATGELVALLDHDDELHPLALHECVRAFQANPGWKMLFTDEDKIDSEGVRSDPYFKSDWNPDLFLSQNCVCHLTVYRKELLDAAGGFRKGWEGAQDWDLTLRIAETLAPAQIGHVPKVLYHWRMIEGSTALAPGEKSYAHLAAMRAVQAHLDRDGGGKVHELAGFSGYFRIERPLPDPAPLASLLIPTRDRVDLLKQCIDSILTRTDYPAYEIIVIDNGSSEPQTHQYFDRIACDPRVRVVPYPHPFNYSAINNFGAQYARGHLIGLLNNDIEVISPHWLREMASHALRPEIGVVGAMLYYPDDTIQHAGVILGVGGVAGHACVGMPRGAPGDKHRAGLAQALSAVTAACALVRRSVFDEVGGLDEKLEVAFNDVDFCLRVRALGYRNLWTPFAELYHHESASRGYENTPEKIARFKKEEAFMRARWGDALLRDPYYNPNLALDSTPFSLAYPPRNLVREPDVPDFGNRP